MVVLAPAVTSGLMLVTAYVNNPVLTPEVFNKWYSEVHVRDMVNNKFASIALRYTNYTVGSGTAAPAIVPASRYLALYNVPDVDFVTKPGTMDKLPLNHEMLPDKVNPVTKWSTWTFTYWLPQQAVEGKTAKEGRSKHVVMVQGSDDGVESWFSKEVSVVYNTI
jgi:hypothetical protein